MTALLAPAFQASRPWWLRLPLWAGLGAVAALGQTPWGLWWVALPAWACAFALWREGGAGWREGWAWGVGFFGLALHWIVEPFLVEPEIYGWMAPGALIFTAAGFALFPLLAFAAARRLALGVGGLAALWALSEALRSVVLTGFPWALPAHVWVGTPIAQAVATIGTPGLSLLTLLLAAALSRPWPWAAPALLGLAGAWVLLDPGAPPPPDPAAPLVRIVQPNVPQREKWDPARQPEHIRRLVDLSTSPAGEAPPAVVIWPETALPVLLSDAGPILRAATGAARAPLATGIVREEGGRYFNSLALTLPGGAVPAIYDKAHLVPFGEYMPLQGLASRLGLSALAARMGSSFTPGPGFALMDLPGIGPVRPLICYESIFAEQVAGGDWTGAGRPRALLLVTNDAWFGERAGPQQHLAIGSFRAIEQGLPLLRAANTGISAVIDARGRVLESLPLQVAGAINAPLPPARAPTAYARWGSWPALLVTLLVLLLAWGVDRRRARP